MQKYLKDKNFRDFLPTDIVCTEQVEKLLTEVSRISWLNKSLMPVH